MQLQGRLRVPAPAASVRCAQLTIRVLDVSRADAAATPVAELIMPWSAEAGASGDTRFALDVPLLDPRSNYALSAHIDVNGSGEVSAGDYLTTTHIGVTEQDTHRVVDVPVQAIG